MKDDKALINQLHELYGKRISLEIAVYKMENANDEFLLPDVKVTKNLREEALGTYTEFEYPNSYITELDKYRANWDIIAGLMV